MALSTAALITLDDAKTHLGISVASHDARLEAFIDAASETIEAYLSGTIVIKRTFAEDYDRSLRRLVRRARKLFLRRLPIVSVASIADSAAIPQTIESSQYSVHKAQGYLLLDETWRIAEGPDGQLGFWTITYDAGIADDTDDVPHRFKQACRIIVGRSFYQRSGGVHQQRVGDLSVTWDSGQGQRPEGSPLGMPDEVVALVSGDRARWA